MNFPSWQGWVPKDRATLCFVVRAGEILLIHKKRGLGAGKINGPGGRIEPGESAMEAAIRETQEELGVIPVNLSLRGMLQFQFTDGYSLHCTVFLAEDCMGEAIETDEAVPCWTPVDKIPYDSMWEDDRYWLPGMLQGKIFQAKFCFQDDKMLEKEIAWEDLSDTKF